MTRQAFYGPVWCSQAGASCEWASRIPTRFGCHRSRRQTNNFSLIRGRPQIISRERMPDRAGMPSDEEIAEISANTVKVAVPYGSKEAKKATNGAGYEYPIRLSGMHWQYAVNQASRGLGRHRLRHLRQSRISQSGGLDQRSCGPGHHQ